MIDIMASLPSQGLSLFEHLRSYGQVRIYLGRKVPRQ